MSMRKFLYFTFHSALEILAMPVFFFFLFSNLTFQTLVCYTFSVLIVSFKTRQKPILTITVTRFSNGTTLTNLKICSRKKKKNHECQSIDSSMQGFGGHRKKNSFSDSRYRNRFSRCVCPSYNWKNNNWNNAFPHPSGLHVKVPGQTHPRSR